MADLKPTLSTKTKINRTPCDGVSIHVGAPIFMNKINRAKLRCYSLYISPWWYGHDHEQVIPSQLLHFTTKSKWAQISNGRSGSPWAGPTCFYGPPLTNGPFHEYRRESGKKCWFVSNFKSEMYSIRPLAHGIPVKFAYASRSTI